MKSDLRCLFLFVGFLFLGTLVAGCGDDGEVPPSTKASALTKSSTTQNAQLEGLSFVSTTAHTLSEQQTYRLWVAVKRESGCVYESARLKSGWSFIKLETRVLRNEDLQNTDLTKGFGEAFTEFLNTHLLEDFEFIEVRQEQFFAGNHRVSFRYKCGDIDRSYFAQFFSDTRIVLEPL